LLISAAVFLSGTGVVRAHHSYTMFDGSRQLTVAGTVAKVEWMNPHVFIWVYVPNAETPGGYDLYAFENGSTAALARLGWTRTTLTPGQKISVEYSPLRDGRKGGHFIRAIHADGTVSLGSGGALSPRDRAAVQGKP
jgi:hypothetical protein